MARCADRARRRASPPPDTRRPCEPTCRGAAQPLFAAH
ncbi:histidine kinase [Burkholderia pseudomallei]|nr:histidine kinase [Burkholderia pseudomallei]AYX35407.1 histidine kinase [Burkholderia pseudomallei]MBG1250396.1 histidine kinase [Burkholderia pseudomallei]NRD84802.1 histidine kinase [Burkholderia pseudomallei]NRE51069.1 histidine kinase [Burkholderia pseudomallei]